MRNPNELRTERLHIRISPEEKQLLIKLAAITGMSFSDIIIESIVDSFNKECEECGLLSLTKNHVSLKP